MVQSFLPKGQHKIIKRFKRNAKPRDKRFKRSVKQIIKNKQCKNDEDFLMQEVKNNNILATCT